MLNKQERKLIISSLKSIAKDHYPLKDNKINSSFFETGDLVLNLLNDLKARVIFIPADYLDFSDPDRMIVIQPVDDDNKPLNNVIKQYTVPAKFLVKIEENLKF